MPKFTPGPWMKGKTGGCVISNDDKNITIRGGTGADAVKYYGGNLIGESISKGNVALIAIAPDMYDLLWTIARKDAIWEVTINKLLKQAETMEVNND
jgi:hypothetical protein